MQPKTEVQDLKVKHEIGSNSTENNAIEWIEGFEFKQYQINETSSLLKQIKSKATNCSEFHVPI